MRAEVNRPNIIKIKTRHSTQQLSREKIWVFDTKALEYSSAVQELNAVGTVRANIMGVKGPGSIPCGNPVQWVGGIL